MGSRPWGTGQRGHDVSGQHAPGLDAKKKTLAASERDAESRGQWREELAKLPAEQFVFVDESSAKVTATPRYARTPTGQRASGTVPRNYPHNTTLVAALSLGGIPAAMTPPGALDGLAFAAYVEHVLVPALRPGQIVVLANLSVHKGREIRTRIEETGCQLRFLPIYSPDFNPIEHVFSKLNERLRRRQARTDGALQAALTDARRSITPNDATHCFRHCGYPLGNQPL